MRYHLISNCSVWTNKLVTHVTKINTNLHLFTTSSSYNRKRALSFKLKTARKIISYRNIQQNIMIDKQDLQEENKICYTIKEVL